MVKVKICGNTNSSDAGLAVQLGADYLGLIFAESKRRVTLEEARRITNDLPDFHDFVGVFCNQAKSEVETVARELGLTYLQFHGDETALYCKHFSDQGFKIIKTFHMRDTMSLKRAEGYTSDYILLDTYSPHDRGGTGRVFDWNLLGDASHWTGRIFLAGGLNPENVGQAVRQIQPYAVDVASGVEEAPGRKSPERLEQFIRLAKSGTPHAA